MIPLTVIFLSLSLHCALGRVSGYYDNGNQDFVTDEENEDVSRIIGGEPAEIEDHPYQCSFIGNNSYFCGAFIISENYILTAAHCAGAKPHEIVLRVGSTYRKNGTIVPIEQVIAHPEYDKPPFDKDVAIMKTAEPIVFNDKVQKIALPESGRKLVPDSIFTVAGWGRTRHGAPTIPERLMAVNTTIVKRELCQWSYSDVMTDHMFCGGRFWFGGKGVCQGDSGGAAVQDGMAIGIVSFGRICGQPWSPSVFADIASPEMRAFIKEHTGL